MRLTLLSIPALRSRLRRALARKGRQCRYANLCTQMFVFLLLASTALAQTTATIVGTVTDSSGAVIPNTKVTAVQKAIGLTRSVTANQSGNYVLSLLPVGEYN